MAEFQRKNLSVEKELRQNPRIEFHHPAILLGLGEKTKIVDFSLSGFFVRLDSPVDLADGQQVHMALLFPHEKNCTVLKAKIVRVEKDGFACKFVDLDPAVVALLERSFDFLRTTLPVD